MLNKACFVLTLIGLSFITHCCSQEIKIENKNNQVTDEYTKYMYPAGDSSIFVFYDLKLAMEYAKIKNLPILLNYTSTWDAVAKRIMEKKVWTNDLIKPILKNKFVIVSLYCHDGVKSPIPKEKWSKIQLEKCNIYRNSPRHIIIDNNANDLIMSVGAREIEEYRLFLEKGFNAYNEKQVELK